MIFDKKSLVIAGRARSWRSQGEPQRMKTQPHIYRLAPKHEVVSNDVVQKGFLSNKERLALGQELSIERNARYYRNRIVKEFLQTSKISNRSRGLLTP